ncbi:MAG: type I-U CRISPR-associated helicase/endonuclease Cas3 [Spirochaetaceae bacterium]|nr:type I-U CRISPR-associated helicase/endonuclease Cas3 [Spirochaetaceae bacterium]
MSNLPAVENGDRGAAALDAEDFALFFRDVHNQDPFPWQQRLTSEVLERRAWPSVIDLPTGTGKTAVLDTAVFAMAAQPDLAPRRVVFVIDRRIVVDQVYERAQRLQSRIEAADTPVLQRVRNRLGELSDGEPLGIAALRGGIPIDHQWTHRPDQPWVMVSTVDQFGSRLLFRGFGVRPGMWPIHAGLAGNDCLVILDEVHLSVPFAQTLAQVARLPCGPVPRRFAIVEMSATPSNKDAQRFTLCSATDLDGCAELHRRVTAAKHATLKSVRNEDALSAEVLRIIKSLHKSERRSKQEVRSVGVIVNRVRTAREVHQALADASFPAYLITGRMRPLDRVAALQRIGPIVDPDGTERPDEVTVVVSTQAIEVGADFSFDALITECAPADSLRQRFGRLDRRGSYAARTGSAAPAWIIALKSVVGNKRPDPIYGDSVRTTWEELQSRATRGSLEVGATGLRYFPENTNAPRADAPLLLPTHLEAWVQTSPRPLVEPPIEWFLHGMSQNRPTDVSIVWRRDRSSEALRLVPPRQAEFLQAPIAAVKSWLCNSDEVDVADVPQEDESNGSTSEDPAVAGKWVRWEGSAEGAKSIEPGQIRPGDILVVAPELGGLSSGSWDPCCRGTVPDLGDEAQIAYRRRATLRLDPGLDYVGSPPRPDQEATSDQPRLAHIAKWLESWADEPGLPTWTREVVERFARGFEVTLLGLDDETADGGYYVLTERHPETRKSLVDPDTLDGGDEAGSLTGTGATLGDHLVGVSIRAARIAESLRVPASIREDLRLAGRLHDLGKVDRRFQLQLVGGDPIDLEMLEHPLAKSLPGAQRVRRVPTGMRHELASTAMIESNDAVLRTAHDRDLVLHLVGTHHGWARPLPPVIEDREPETLSFTLDGHVMNANSNLVESHMAMEMADRFWRLLKRYGYHGLAWLEAILRLADHQQSAAESE